MPTPYQRALNHIATATRVPMSVALAALVPHVPGQVKWNVENETALADGDFISLLNAFSAQLTSGTTPDKSWEAACHAHQFRGCAIGSTQCPQTLGRVKGLQAHAKDVADASNGDYVAEEVLPLLRAHSGSLKPKGFEQCLRDAVLGNFTIWATFDADDGASNPFAKLPHAVAGIRAALGLGHLTDTDPIVILVWDHAGAGAPPLHRPSIADAENNPYFRPHHDREMHCGWTYPLPHTPALTAQPEVVMHRTACKGLILPFHVIEA
jgi:hypothetical protein